MDLKIDSHLLHAFAVISDGGQFKPDQLHCRLVPSVTSEGYPTPGLSLEFYGVPFGIEMYKRVTGRDTADIVFASIPYEGPASVEGVTEVRFTNGQRPRRRGSAQSCGHPS